MKQGSGNRRRAISLFGLLVLVTVSLTHAGTFTGPDEWRLVNTNAVRAWQEAQKSRASATFRVWPGVAVDVQKREVRLLAEAVGHDVGVTTEFLLIGPLSDRAYETVAVTVAMPGDIVRAVESMGIARGGCVGSQPFRFWPVGERVTAAVRRLDVPHAVEKPLQALIRDAEAGAPLIGEGGLIFTGGRWENGACLTDTNMPAALISLYNASETVFDVPFQVGQSEVYGRLSLAEALPYGALLEVVLRPLAADGKPRVFPVRVFASEDGGNVVLTCKGADDVVLHKAGLADAVTWLRGQSESGRELFVTLGMDDALPLKRAADVARLFVMMDGKGLKLDGKTAGGVFPRAFVPLEKWREREGRNPQPFEVHVTQPAGGKLSKKLVFVEEDWSVEGLDPKLTPREFPFEAWEELPGMINKAAGSDNKVQVLFVFAPLEMPLGRFMPGVRAVADRLPLVYVFGE